MSLAAIVTAVDRASARGDTSPCWLVTVAVSPPSAWAPNGQLCFDLKRVPDVAPPIAVGERVTVPVTFVDQHLAVHRPGGDVRLKIIGSVRDPNAPLH